METLRFVMLLLILVLLQVWASLGTPVRTPIGTPVRTPVSSEEERRDAWPEEDWQGYPLQRGLSLRLADLVKRSQQFHGLMGRSPESEPPQPGRLGRKSEFYSRTKGNKGEMFVGLMGRRSSGRDGDEEWRSDFY